MDKGVISEGVISKGVAARNGKGEEGRQKERKAKSPQKRPLPAAPLAGGQTPPAQALAGGFPEPWEGYCEQTSLYILFLLDGYLMDGRINIDAWAAHVRAFEQANRNRPVVLAALDDIDERNAKLGTEPDTLLNRAIIRLGDFNLRGSCEYDSPDPRDARESFVVYRHEVERLGFRLSGGGHVQAAPDWYAALTREDA